MFETAIDFLGWKVVKRSFGCPSEVQFAFSGVSLKRVCVLSAKIRIFNLFKSNKLVVFTFVFCMQIKSPDLSDLMVKLV